MKNTNSHMRREIESIPHAIDQLLSQGAVDIINAAELINSKDINYIMSVARGSSDHACSYLKYASELILKLPMASMGPSISSIYDVNVDAKNALCLAISQSGQSPDIVSMLHANQQSGALGIAFTNDTNSPLANKANTCLPIYAGEEISVAATKTFVMSIISGLWLFAVISKNTELTHAIKTLPEHLEKAAHCDWSEVMSSIDGSSVFTLGRGPAWAISNEAALKFKETCQIHAESYSSAEVLHGPVSIVDHGFPIIGFAAADAAEASLVDVCDTLSKRGAQVFVTSDKAQHANGLEIIRTDHWLTDPISLIVSFYSMVEQLSRSRGLNPDIPPHLNKVTETV